MGVKKLMGDLDKFYIRYEKCAGAPGSNLDAVSIEGHGTPTGESHYPKPKEELLAGRYYVSVKGKGENCGKFDLTVTHYSPGSSLQASWAMLACCLLLCGLSPFWTRF